MPLHFPLKNLMLLFLGFQGAGDGPQSFTHAYEVYTLPVRYNPFPDKSWGGFT